MAIQILDYNRLSASFQKISTTPHDAQQHQTDHSGHHVALFLLLRWSPKLSLVGPRKPLQSQEGKIRQSQNTTCHLMRKACLCSPSDIPTSKWLVVSLDALMSNHTMESVARVFARRTFEHRLVLLGLTRYHEAPVDGLPLWRELQSTCRYCLLSDKGLMHMLAEPRRGLNILFNEGPGFVV